MKKCIKIIVAFLFFISCVLTFTACKKNYDYTLQFFVGDNVVSTKHFKSGGTIGKLPEYKKDGFTLLSWHYEDGSEVNEDDIVSSNNVIYAKLSYKLELSDNNLTEEMISNIKLAKKVSVITLNNNVLSGGVISKILDQNVGEIDFSLATFENNIINDELFKNRESLIKVAIPDSATIIGRQAFQNCINLEEVVFGGELLEIKEKAFAGCNKIKTIDLNEKLEKINNNAFSYMGGLESIYIKSKVDSINVGFIDGDLNLTTINVSQDNKKYFSIDGVLYIKESGVDDYGNDVTKYKLVRCPEGKSGEYTMYEKTSIIGEKSFYNCKNLIKVNLSSSENYRGSEIQTKAFYGAENLEEVVFSVMLKNIGDYAFYGAHSLKTMNIKDTRIEKIGDYAFYGCESLEKLSLPKTINILGNYSFCGATNLVDVLFENNTEELELGNRVFYNLSNLKNVVIDMTGVINVNGIGDYAFSIAYPMNGFKNPNKVAVIVLDRTSFLARFAASYENLENIVR